MPPKKPKPETPLFEDKEESQHESYAISEDYGGGMREGRWTFNESNLFMKLYKQHNNNWIEIAQKIPTRTAEQVRSHAQKILSRQKRKEAEKKLREDTLRKIEREGDNRVTRSFVFQDNDGHNKNGNPPESSKSKNKKESKKKELIHTTTVKTKTNEQSNTQIHFQSSVTENNAGSKNIVRPQFEPPREPVEFKSLLYQIFSPCIINEYAFPLFGENNCKAEESKFYLGHKNNQQF